jgi:hypothetical protein
MSAEPRHDVNRRLLRPRDAMDRSYADALDVEALANSVHLSRAHFIRSSARRSASRRTATSSGGGWSARWRSCARPTGR